MMLEDQPRVELPALMRLRKLIAQQSMPAGQDGPPSGSMMAKGDRHEPRSRT
jgi:hypothetical protein